MRSFAAGINHPLASLSEEMEDGKNNPFVLFPSSAQRVVKIPSRQDGFSDRIYSIYWI